MDKSIERLITKICKAVFKDVFDKKSSSDIIDGKTEDVMQKAVTIESSDKYNKFAETFAKKLATKGLAHEKGVWRKYFEAAKKAGHIAYNTNLKDFEWSTYKAATLENFKMIKSIPTRMLETLQRKYISTMTEEVIKGSLPRGTFYKELLSHGAKHAKLIARTETAKLQTVVARTRAIQLGSVAYFWKASHDNRTRKSHREMDGVIVFWRENLQKPLRDNMRGDSGEFPNCRCDCEPILDEDDLALQSYKVYDYRTDKIIRLSKSQVIKAIKANSLDVI